MFSLYPGYHKFLSAHSEFFQSLNKGRMWLYNITEDTKGRISHLLWIDLTTSWHVKLAADLFALKRETFETIIEVKGTKRS